MTGRFLFGGLTAQAQGEQAEVLAMAEGHGAGVLSAVAATQSAELTGIHLALGVDVAVTLVSVVLVWYGLRPRGKAGTHAAAVAAQREPAQSDEELAAAAD